MPYPLSRRLTRITHTPWLASTAWTDAMAVGLHSLSYVLVSTLIAWVVYRKLGVAFLRVAWFNLDWLWAGALVVTGMFVVLS